MNPMVHPRGKNDAKIIEKYKQYRRKMAYQHMSEIEGEEPDDFDVDTMKNTKRS